MITRTQGNAFEVIVPLYTRTLHEDGTIDIAEYTPQDDDVIIVTLAGCRNYRYNAEGGDKCCIFKMTGAEVAGIYALEVVLIQADGKRLRYAVKEALQLTCETSEDDVQGAEFTASGVTLDAAWFFFAKGDKGDDGRGIVNIAKIGSVGLVDTYRILYTDGGITTFEVTNGKDGGSVDAYTKAESDARFAMLDNISQRITISEAVVGSDIRFLDMGGDLSKETSLDYFAGYGFCVNANGYNIILPVDDITEDVAVALRSDLAGYAKRNDATQTITASGIKVSDVQFNGGNLNTDSDGNLRYDGDKLLVDGDIPEVVQTTGQATDKVMSQKAVTDLIGNVEQLLASI